jgi:hypothetical protein
MVSEGASGTGLFMPDRVLRHEVAHQAWNLTGAIAQRGNGDREDARR